MAFPLEQSISNIWNASIEEVHEDYFVIKNAGWNQDIAVDGSVSFGITCYEAFSVFPEYYTLLGNEVELASGDYSVAYEITEDWGEGYKALVTITNNKSVALEDWRIKFNYGDNVITQIWDAVIISQNEGEYYLSCQPYNQNIEAGKSISFGFLVEPGTSDGKIEEIVISEYNVGATSEEIPDNDKDDDSDDTSGEGTGDDTGDIPDKEDEKSEEVNLEDAFVGLLGEVNEDNKEIELYIFSNIECEKYEIYVSYDGLEYMLYDTTEESTYYYSQEFTYVKFYVIGCYSEDMYIESPWLSVSNRGESYSIYMEDTDTDFLTDYEEVNIYFTDPCVADTDKDMLGDIPFENLMFLWYDEAGKQFVELETTHDEKNGIWMAWWEPEFFDAKIQ